MNTKFYTFGGIIIMEIQTTENIYEYYVRPELDNTKVFEFVFGVEEPFTEVMLKALHKVKYFNTQLEGD